MVTQNSSNIEKCVIPNILSLQIYVFAYIHYISVYNRVIGEKKFINELMGLWMTSIQEYSSNHIIAFSSLQEAKTIMVF
jgi:hypothetical protein